MFAVFLLSQGSIADTRPRENLSGYLNVHMMLGAVQLVMAALGIVLMTRYESSCRGVLTDEAVNILLLVVTTSQVRARFETGRDEMRWAGRCETPRSICMRPWLMTVVLVLLQQEWGWCPWLPVLLLLPVPYTATWFNEDLDELEGGGGNDERRTLTKRRMVNLKRLQSP